MAEEEAEEGWAAQVKAATLVQTLERGRQARRDPVGAAQRARAVASRLASLDAHSARVTSLGVATDGYTFLSSSADCTVILWDLPTLAPLRTFSFNAPVSQALQLPTADGFLAAVADTVHRVSLSGDVAAPSKRAAAAETLRDHGRRLGMVRNRRASV